MNVTSSLIIITLILFIFFGSRRIALLAFMAGVLYLPVHINISIGGFNLFPIRFFEVAAFARVVLKRELTFSKLNHLDKVFVFFYLFMTVVFVLRSEWGYAYQIGVCVDALLLYFAFRGLIANILDLNIFLLHFAFMLMAFAIIVFVQRVTATNLFEIFGANIKAVELRDGIPRLYGTFSHPILMGSFGAVFLPLYIGLLLGGSNKLISIIGILSSIGIVVLSHSGGPLAGAGISIIGWGFWAFRRKMDTVRIWMVVVFLFVVATMKAPIWFLPARISRLTGGGGWHRSELLDRAIADLDKWWLFGMDIKETINWFPYSIEIYGGADITNQFLSFGLSAGVLTIIIFLYILFLAFRNIGNAMKPDSAGIESEQKFLIWGLGVAVIVHISNWFGVPYFDKSISGWMLQLSVISALIQKSGFFPRPVDKT